MEPSTIIGQEMAKADADTTFKLSSENLAKLQGLRQEVGFTFPFIVQYVCLLTPTSPAEGRCPGSLGAATAVTSPRR